MTYREQPLSMDQHLVRLEECVDYPRKITTEIDADSSIHPEPWVWLNIEGEEDEIICVKLTLAEARDLSNQLALTSYKAP